jgi:PLD-like domain
VIAGRRAFTGRGYGAAAPTLVGGGRLLLTRDELLGQLRDHLKASERVDLAVAWTTPCDALKRLCKFAKARSGAVRAIIGTWGNATHPNALRDLQECAQLRLMTGILFHPKFYLFHQNERRIGWIGSANLTCRGFEQNEELVFEFLDEGGQASGWFNHKWGELDGQDTKNLLRDYNQHWTPPPPPPRTSRLHDLPTADAFYEIARTITNWPSFVDAIDQADFYWKACTENWGYERPVSVTGEYDSWLCTIILGQNTLSTEDRHLLMGIGTGYGLLGVMGAAGRAQNVFNEAKPQNLAIRQSIRQALQPVIDASDASFAKTACNFIAHVKEIPGFAGGIATRFLALARPDRAISVNNGSRTCLAELTGLPPNALSNPPHGRAKSYMDLLRWFEQQEWYSHPTPQNSRERLLAKTRAALIDALVWNPEMV